MLHNLTGTLCVAGDFLGTKNCNKKIVFNTASKRGAKICPFYSGNCTKITKRKTQKKQTKKNQKKKTPRVSQVIVIACLHHTRTVCT